SHVVAPDGPGPFRRGCARRRRGRPRPDRSAAGGGTARLRPTAAGLPTAAARLSAATAGLSATAAARLSTAAARLLPASGLPVAARLRAPAGVRANARTTASQPTRRLLPPHAHRRRHRTRGGDDLARRQARAHEWNAVARPRARWRGDAEPDHLRKFFHRWHA